MAKVTLDELRRDAETEYAPVELVDGDGVTVTFQSLLMLSREKRRAFKARARELEAVGQDAEAAADLDEEDVILDLLAMVADDPARAREMLGGQSLGPLQMLFSRYMETAQPGEASASPTS